MMAGSWWWRSFFFSGNGSSEWRLRALVRVDEARVVLAHKGPQEKYQQVRWAMGKQMEWASGQWVLTDTSPTYL